MTLINSLVRTLCIIFVVLLSVSAAVMSQGRIKNGPQTGEFDQEIVILVDNSAGMRGVDPLYLVRSEIADFTASLNPDSYISLMVYDDNVRSLIPLSTVNNTDPLQLKNALENISYTGRSSDLVMAIERAVYELNYTGQNESQKFIVIISGSQTTTVDDDESIRPDEALIAALSNANVEIHAVAMSTEANLQNLQILGGQSKLQRHFVPEIASLSEILKQINASLKSKRRATSVQQSQPQAQGNNTSGIIAQVTNPAATNRTGQSTSLGSEERTRSLLIIIAAIVLFTTLLTLIILLYIQYRKFTQKPDFAESDAYLKDIHGYTSKENFQLGKKATMLGRVAGKDSSNIDYFVIPEPTIGRRHAVIEYKDYGYWITDQGSINGTFVNDILINSEIRLKHGDIIKLHKFEFEFAIPELEDSTMTRVSDTVIAHGGAYRKPTSSTDLEINAVIDSLDGDGPGLDFDFSSAASDATQQPADIDGINDTLSPDFDSTETQARVKTINPNDHLARKKSGIGENDNSVKDSNKQPWDDLTIIPGQDKKPDEIYDINSNDDNKQKNKK
jgi:pSer/pThr/pTyr-binding forkhead associated (FHA) protein